MLKKITTVFMYVMGVGYMVAGAIHFIKPEPYLKMSEFLPYPLAAVYISGIAEILGGLGLMIPATRRYAAFGIIFLLIAITPAHIYMLMHPERWPDIPMWALWARLPLQLVLMYLANIYTKTSNAFYGERSKEQPTK